MENTGNSIKIEAIIFEGKLMPRNMGLRYELRVCEIEQPQEWPWHGKLLRYFPQKQKRLKNRITGRFFFLDTERRRGEAQNEVKNNNGERNVTLSHYSFRFSSLWTGTWAVHAWHLYCHCLYVCLCARDYLLGCAGDACKRYTSNKNYGKIFIKANKLNQ